MANARNLSTLAQGASTAGILAGTYGGTGASLSPTTAGNTIFTTDGTNWSSTQKIVRGTSVTLTTQTSVDFTSIPSWVKRITIIYNAVSTSGSSNYLMQLGSGSFTTSGYASTAAYTGPGTNGTTSTAGFLLVFAANAPNLIRGNIIITNISGNIWVCSSLLARDDGYVYVGGGNISLSGTLDRVRLTTVNGTDTFDAGSVNILYE